jgi:uncharacterized protein (TIGR02145 family)/prepilin-type N-terminal cleavage/methylation domain-containing protein
VFAKLIFLYFMKSKKAFTLIELLVVIAIIGILATISILALSNARAKSRDAKRAGDMKQIQTALELFFNDKQRYPTADEWASGQIYSTSTNATSTYMQIIPSAPTPADGNCSTGQNSVNYFPTSDGASYSISFCLGNTTGTLSSGPKCLTPGGIVNVDCSTPPPCADFTLYNFTSCGDTFTYCGESYPTVSIGGECWMAKNINVGARIDSPLEQSNNGIFEKYCYNNSTTECSNYGGLYQWNEAMQYSATESAQGICPSGWHLPSDNEFTALTRTVIGDPGCDPTTGCAPAGEVLKASATSTPVAWNGTNDYNFSAIPSSYRDLDGTSNYQGTYGFFWTSTVRDVDNAWHRLLDTGTTTVFRYYDFKTYGFAVRCIKNNF